MLIKKYKKIKNKKYDLDKIIIVTLFKSIH